MKIPLVKEGRGDLGKLLFGSVNRHVIAALVAQKLSRAMPCVSRFMVFDRTEAVKLRRDLKSGQLRGKALDRVGKRLTDDRAEQGDDLRKEIEPLRHVFPTEIIHRKGNRQAVARAVDRIGKIGSVQLVKTAGELSLAWVSAASLCKQRRKKRVGGGAPLGYGKNEAHRQDLGLEAIGRIVVKETAVFKRYDLHFGRKTHGVRLQAREAEQRSLRQARRYPRYGSCRA